MSTTLTNKAYETIATVLSTEMNSLANAGYTAASAAQGADGTGGPLYGDFELVLASLDPTVFTLAELYILASADGTNYADTPASTNPATNDLVGVFVGLDTSSAKRAVLRDVPLPPGLWKAVIKNVSGVSMSASNNTLKVRAHNLLST